MAFGGNANRPADRVGSAALLTALGAAIGMLRHVDADGPAAAFMGGWKAPVGIALVADRFTAIMLLVSAVVLLGVLMFAMGQPGTEQEQPSFHPVYLVLAAGVFLSFLTGDLFNLFVAFEMMLTASYILITLGGRLDQVRSGMTYVVINLVASTFFVVLLGLCTPRSAPSTWPTSPERMHTVAERCPGRVRAADVRGVRHQGGGVPAVLLAARQLPGAPTAVTAVFAGLLTKVGVYCLIRTQTLMVGVGDRISTVHPVIAGFTMVSGCSARSRRTTSSAS
jgi:multicomponent Na+:H+ antiporter subunit D